MAIIEVKHITKEYRLGQLQSLKRSMLNMLEGLRGRALPERPLFKALDDVDFSVNEGEVVGIIGQNGAGKSTLLKMLARISVPTRGSVSVNGKVAPLIEVGAGLVPDLTGRENIYLNGTILGMKKADLNRKFDDIVAFAELEEFIDTPIKRYSSGMQVRLGFSIATNIDAKILIVDEVLAVGDLAFQRKCFDRMEDMIKRQGKTVLLVSHNIRQVERMCDRVLLMEKGRVVADGKPSKVCDLFYSKSDERISENADTDAGNNTGRFEASGEIELLEISMLDDKGEVTSKVKHNSDITVQIKYRAHVLLKKPVFGVGVHTTDFLYLATQNSQDYLTGEELPPGCYVVRCVIKNFPFLPGVYSLRVGVAVGEFYSTAFYAENAYHFQVESEQKAAFAEALREGFVPLDTDWGIAPAAGEQAMLP